MIVDGLYPKAVTEAGIVYFELAIGAVKIQMLKLGHSPERVSVEEAHVRKVAERTCEACHAIPLARGPTEDAAWPEVPHGRRRQSILMIAHTPATLALGCCLRVFLRQPPKWTS